MGLPSQLEVPDDTSESSRWNQKRLARSMLDHDGDATMNIASFDGAGKQINRRTPSDSNGSTGSNGLLDDQYLKRDSLDGALKRNSLDKFTFDILETYDNINNINIEAAAAIAVSAGGQKRSRVRSDTTNEELHTDHNSGHNSSHSSHSGSDADQADQADGRSDATLASSSSSSNPGSISPVTAAKGGFEEHPADERKKESDGTAGNVQVVSLGSRAAAYGLKGSKSSTRSSLTSNASANSFLNAFDEDEESFESLYPVGQEEESFMSFEKVNEHRLQSGSDESFAMFKNQTLMKKPLMTSSKPPPEHFEEEEKKESTARDGGSGSNGSNGGSGGGRGAQGQEEKLSNADVGTSGSSRGGQHVAGPMVGVSLNDSSAPGPAASSLGTWFINNWRSPRFVCFVVGVAVSLTFIVISFAMLLQGQGSGGSDGSDGSKQRFLRLK
jgi:hypothetical protein